MTLGRTWICVIGTRKQETDMETRLFDSMDIQKWKVQLPEAASILRAGGLVAFPTETVYGLGADGLNPRASEKIYQAKGRPSDNPLIVHIAQPSDLSRLTDSVPPMARKLMRDLWPGPLTMIFEKKKEVPYETTGGLDTVAVRMPDHPVALELIMESGCLLAGPSANQSGRPSPTSWQHVYEDLNGRIDAIVQGHNCRVGIESTVLDMTSEEPAILRPGMVTPEQIEKIIGMKVNMDPALFVNRPRDVNNGLLLEEAGGPAPKAPGMKYRHYAPRAEMLILEGTHENVAARLVSLAKEEEAKGRKVGCLQFSTDDFEGAAHDFFAQLRQMDEDGVDLILAGALSRTNSVGFAVMNRMMKSAGYHILQV